MYAYPSLLSGSLDVWTAGPRIKIRYTSFLGVFRFLVLVRSILIDEYIMNHHLCMAYCLFRNYTYTLYRSGR